MRLLRWFLFELLTCITLTAHAQTSYNYFAPGGALSCTSPCTSQSVNLNSGVSLLNTLPNSKLTNPAITINGTSVSLGGTRTLNLASADFSNQGTTTTVLHGNGAGNPSFSALNLATDTTGTLSLARIATCAATNVLFASSATAAACSTKFTWNDTTNILKIGNNALDGTIENDTTNKITLGPNDGVHLFATSIDMVIDHGDIFITGSNNPLLLIQNTVANVAGFNGFQFANEIGDGINFGNQPSAAPSCSYQNAVFYTLTPAGPCSLVDSGSQNTNPLPLVLGVNGHTTAVFQNNDALLAVGTTPTQYSRATYATGVITSTYGDNANAGSITNIRGGSAANTRINGSQACSNSTGCPATSTALTGTTGSIGGSLLAAGGCSTGTVSITGATTSMAAVASPAAGTNPDPGALGVYWRARVSSTNTITVDICTPLAGTPTADTYNVRVIQ